MRTLLVVVSILALACNRFNHARAEKTRVDAQTIRSAAELHQAASGTCPTIQDLVGAKELDVKNTSDPWGHPFHISCDPTTVTSDGPDGLAGNADDIRVP